MFRAEEKYQEKKESFGGNTPQEKSTTYFLDCFIRDDLGSLSGVDDMFIEMSEYLKMSEIVSMLCVSHLVLEYGTKALRAHIVGRGSRLYAERETLPFDAINFLKDIALYEATRTSTAKQIIARITFGLIEETQLLNGLFNLKSDIKQFYGYGKKQAVRVPRYFSLEEISCIYRENNHITSGALSKIKMEHTLFWPMFLGKDIIDYRTWVYSNKAIDKEISKLGETNKKLYMLINIAKELTEEYAEKEGYVNVVLRLLESYIETMSEEQKKYAKRKLELVKSFSCEFIRAHNKPDKLDECHVWQKNQYEPFLIKYSMFASYKYEADYEVNWVNDRDGLERTYHHVLPKFFYPYRDAIVNCEKAIKIEKPVASLLEQSLDRDTRMGSCRKQG